MKVSCSNSLEKLVFWWFNWNVNSSNYFSGKYGYSLEAFDKEKSKIQNFLAFSGFRSEL